MFFVVDKRAAVRSANSNTASPRCVVVGDTQETNPYAFSAKPKASVAASDLRFQPG